VVVVAVVVVGYFVRVEALICIPVAVLVLLLVLPPLPRPTLRAGYNLGIYRQVRDRKTRSGNNMVLVVVIVVMPRLTIFLFIVEPNLID
jgi:hypothetical protein